MINPSISIIIPVFNVENYLRQCLDSVKAQTYVDFEAILVDDGSTDSSGVICDEYASKDNRFFVVHKQNEGVAKARITAFEHCKGELVTFIDSDDYVSPEYLERLSKPILEGGADMVSCDYYKIDNNIIIEPRPRLTGIWEKSNLDDFITNHFFYDEQIQGYGMTIFLWTKMVRRSIVLSALLIGKDMWYAEDQLAVFHMLKQSNRIALISDRLYYYVQHQGQVMKKYDYSLWENLIFLMEKYKEFDKENIAADGIRKRTWLHIQFTIFSKMTKANLPRKTFCEHISKMRSHKYMNEFFHPYYINSNYKDNILYWLLKLRQFKMFYFILRVKFQSLR